MSSAAEVPTCNGAPLAQLRDYDEQQWILVTDNCGRDVKEHYPHSVVTQALAAALMGDVDTARWLLTAGRSRLLTRYVWPDYNSPEWRETKGEVV